MTIKRQSNNNSSNYISEYITFRQFCNMKRLYIKRPKKFRREILENYLKEITLDNKFLLKHARLTNFIK